MASDHLGLDVDRSSEVLPPGHGFGLGFGVRLQNGISPMPGSAGDYSWGGWAGTTFRISPQDLLFAILMVQAPDYLFISTRRSPILHRRPCLILDFPSIIPACSRPP